MPSTLETCTSSSRPGSPSAGDTLFETDTKKIITYSGTDWYLYDADGGETVTNAKALDFDGTDDALTVAGSSALDLNVDFTISGWFKTDSNVSWSAIAGWGENSSKKFRGFGLNAANQLVFNNNGGFYNPNNASTISTGTWHHGVATLQSNAANSNAVATVYLNGAFDSGKVETSSPLTAFTYSNTEIGGSNYGGAEHFDGKIDEVAIWNTVLSPKEITAIYNSGVANFNLGGNTGNYNSAGSLVGWWRNGDGTEAGSGTTIYDMSSNSNNMAMVSAPSYVTDVPS
jgi:hypothetical protein